MRRVTDSIPWNLFLITLGAAIFSFGIKAIVVRHGFIAGGVSGLGLLLYYMAGALGPGTWYFLLNIPLMVLGWFTLSRRFIFYTLYGMVALSFGMDLATFQVAIQEPMLAAIFGGAVMGAGLGIILRSMGSAGGTDILAVWLHQKYNLRIGQFNFLFNLAVFGVGLFFYDVDLVLYSMVLSFVYATVTDWFLSMFNQRKMALIVSDRSDEIASDINARLNRGATFLFGSGAYTGKGKKVIMTVINTFEVKRLEELVFERDPGAFFVVDNTFNVLGEGFSRRKIY